jgi:hypothetical protein
MYIAKSPKVSGMIIRGDMGKKEFPLSLLTSCMGIKDPF